jgi:hypothetical protein
MTLKRYLILASVALGIVTLVLFPELRPGSWILMLFSLGGVLLLAFWLAVVLGIVLFLRLLWRLGGRS